MATSTPANSRARRKLRHRQPRILVLEGLSSGSTCIRAAGGDVTELSPYSVTQKLIDTLASDSWDGLLLTGGADVDPRRYGAKPHPQTHAINETRDAIEIMALARARQRGVPVLGICRGAQIMNVEAGGTLKQHIKGHSGGMHAVEAYTGSVLEQWAGQRMYVLSLHHQMVQRPGKGMVIVGRDPKGIVEAIASSDGRCLGVQFHPEMDSGQPYSQGIFDWLVAEAAKRAGLRAPKRNLTLSAHLDDSWYTGWYGYDTGGIERQYGVAPKWSGKHRQAGDRTEPASVAYDADGTIIDPADCCDPASPDSARCIGCPMLDATDVAVTIDDVNRPTTDEAAATDADMIVGRSRYNPDPAFIARIEKILDDSQEHHRQTIREYPASDFQMGRRVCPGCRIRFDSSRDCEAHIRMFGHEV